MVINQRCAYWIAHCISFRGSFRYPGTLDTSVAITPSQFVKETRTLKHYAAIRLHLTTGATRRGVGGPKPS